MTDHDRPRTLPTSSIKSLLGEDSNMGQLPAHSLNLISAASLLFVKNLVRAAQTPNPPHVNLEALQTAIAANPSFQFLSATVKGRTEGSTVLTKSIRKRKAPSKKPPPATKKRTPSSLPCADMAEALKVAESIQPTLQEVEPDESDYD